MTLQVKIPSTEEIAKFCRKHHILKLSVFGSALRKDFTPESDVDILVEFIPDKIPGFFRLIEIQEELSALCGYTIDLRTPNDISRHFRDEVLASAEVQYFAGR